MAIQKRPNNRSDDFEQGAPDAPTAGLRRGNRRQITITIGDDMLAAIDAKAKRYDLSRAAALRLAVANWLEE